MSDATRIGDAEREAAIQALQHHLSAGRIDLDEFDERAARVAAARTRGELAPLFADLPEPHALGAVAPAPSVTGPSWQQVRQRSSGPLGGPLLGRFGEAAVALSPFIALALFFTLHVWWVWLLIPAAGALVYGNPGYGGRTRRRR